MAVTMNKQKSGIRYNKAKINACHQFTHPMVKNTIIIAVIAKKTGINIFKYPIRFFFFDSV